MTSASSSKSESRVDPSAEAGPKLPRTILSSDLLQGAREVQIQHGEAIYRLLLTRSGKLILNK